MYVVCFRCGCGRCLHVQQHEICDQISSLDCSRLALPLTSSVLECF